MLVYPEIVQQQLDVLIHDPIWLTARQAIWAEKVRPSEATELSRNNLKLLERFFIYGDLAAVLELNLLCTWAFTYSPVVTPESATFFWGEYAAHEVQQRGNYYRWQEDCFLNHAYELLCFYPFNKLHDENYFCGISRDTRLQLFDWFFSQLCQEKLPFSIASKPSSESVAIALKRQKQFAWIFSLLRQMKWPFSMASLPLPKPVALPLKKAWLPKYFFYCDITGWLSGEPQSGGGGYSKPCLIDRPGMLTEIISMAPSSAFFSYRLDHHDPFRRFQYFIWHLLAICCDYTNPFGVDERGASRQAFIDGLRSYLESDKAYAPLQSVWKRIQAPDVQIRHLVFLAWPADSDPRYPQFGEKLTQWLKRVGLMKHPLWLELKKQNTQLENEPSQPFPDTNDRYWVEWPSLAQGINFADGMRTLFAEAGCSEVRIWRSFHSFGPQVLAEEERNFDD